MVHDPDDTICAIASPPGGSARGIIRLSGPHSIGCVAAFCETRSDAWRPGAPPTGPSSAPPTPSSLQRPTMLAARLRADGLTCPVPCDLYVWPTARSYTRQPSAEIHTIGAPPILQAVLRTACRLGARLAGPGEFTLRAFLAGRLDLTQAEAVLGVIEANGRRDLDVALTQLAGGLGGPLTRLRDELLDLLAHLEAGLDFVEDDIEFISRDALVAQLSTAAHTVQELAARTTARAVVGDAVRVTIIGRPNIGKSSLFNALLAQSAAIVSPAAGTTRDYLTAELTLGDVRIELVDTAGLGDSTLSPATRIDRAAQGATLEQRRQTTIELLCLDGGRSPDAWEQSELAERSPARIVAITKADQPMRLAPFPAAILTSSTTGAGLDELRAQLQRLATEVRCEGSDVVSATAARCQESLRAAAEALAQAQQLATTNAGEELVAAVVRDAIDHLGQVVGAVYTEDLLDRIFSRFCIGK